MPESWSIQSFSLALPEGGDRSDVPALLRHLANNLEEFGPVAVQDITFETEVTADGFVCSFTVYFHPRKALGEDSQARS